VDLKLRLIRGSLTHTSLPPPLKRLAIGSAGLRRSLVFPSHTDLVATRSIGSRGYIVVRTMYKVGGSGHVLWGACAYQSINQREICRALLYDTSRSANSIQW